MPTYEWKCKYCGHVWGTFELKIGARPEGCPACKGTNFKQQPSVPAAPIFNANDFPGNEMKSKDQARKSIQQNDKDIESFTRDHGETNIAAARAKESREQTKK